MATAHPAPPQAGTETSEPKITGAETELKVTPPATASSVRVRAPRRLKRDLDEPSGELADAAEVAARIEAPVVHSVEVGIGDSSAAHLVGMPAEEIHEVDTKFQRLLTTVRENRPSDDLEVIRKAWEFCMRQHEGQKRASGEPYIIHPLEVAQVLAELKMDSTAIAAGLLHDAVEDTDVTSAEIAKRFGEQVAHIVEGVTKLDKIKFANREDHQAENIRKMLLAMVTDVRVVLIKLADRL